MPLRRSPRPTDRALEARRRNALKSTGPRTARGKARVRLNSLQHGRRSAHLARFVARMGLNWRLIRGLDQMSCGPDEDVGPVLRPIVRRWLAEEYGIRSRELERFECRVLEQERKTRQTGDELPRLLRELLATRGLSPPLSVDQQTEARKRAKLECTSESTK